MYSFGSNYEAEKGIRNSILHFVYITAITAAVVAAAIIIIIIIFYYYLVSLICMVLTNLAKHASGICNVASIL
jgi:hypothetical protein